MTTTFGSRRLLVCIILAMSSVLLVLPTQEADAASPSITSSANVRSCVNTSSTYCAPFGTFAGGTPVTQVCWIDGSWATGEYASNRWFLVRRSDRFEAFVHSSMVRNQVSTPNCGSVQRVKAGLEAIKRMGQTYASSSDASLFSASSWSPGPYGEWSGDCKKLAYVAYYRAGLTLVSGNAKPTFDYYWARRSSKGGGYPLYGALVGWDIVRPYGHIAVAVGGNRVATTRGMDHDARANAILTTGSFSNYLGWVVP